MSLEPVASTSGSRSELGRPQAEEEKTSIQKILYPDPEDLPDDFSMPIWDHLDELRERVIVAALAAATAVLTCFAFSKDLVVFLEAPVAEQGVRFLQLSPGEFFFTTIKASSVALLRREACLLLKPCCKSGGTHRWLATLDFSSLYQLCCTRLWRMLCLA